MRHLALVAVLLLAAALAGACGNGGPDEAGRNTVSPGAGAAATAGPTQTPAPSPSLRQPLYIALGDSLSAGIAATRPLETSFVPLVQRGLGDEVGLLNLGVPGDTSDDLLHEAGRLDRALAEIESRKSDSVAGNEVMAVTLEIGGNDLLRLYFGLVETGTCPNVEEGLQRPQCVQALRDALTRFKPNLEQALRRLQEADAELPVFLMTLYNPFSGGLAALEGLSELALEGLPDTPFPEGLNDTVREEAAAFDVHLVDIHPLFAGKARQLVSLDFIHPNDAGYRVMADAVLAEMERAGIPVRR